MFKNEKLLISNEDNFYLKQLSRIDVTENYINWLNDYEVVKYTEQRHLKHSYDSVCQFVEQNYIFKENYLFGIYYDKKHIGNVKLGPISFSNKKSEISYFIGEKKHWGKGLATQTINFYHKLLKINLI